MLSADIQTIENNNNNGVNSTSFQSPSGATIWAPTFYDPFQVKHRRRTSKKQFGVLEKAFNENPKPNAATRRDLAEKLKMTVRGVQVWFQNRRAKAKTQRRKVNGKKNSAVNSPSENESNHGGNNSNDNYSDTNLGGGGGLGVGVNGGGNNNNNINGNNINGGNNNNSNTTNLNNNNNNNNNNNSLNNSNNNSCSGNSSINGNTEGLREDDEQEDLLDMDGKLKSMDKEYCSDSLISNNYFPVEDDTNQGGGNGIVHFSDSSSDYFFDKHEGLNQGMNSTPTQLHSDFYGNSQQQINMNRSRSRAKSLPNVFHLGMYMPQQQQSAHLSNQLNSQIQFQGIQQTQLPNQSQSYSLMSGPKSSNGSNSTLSQQNLQFLQQKSFSPNNFSLYSQKTQLPPINTSNDASSASSPSLSVASGSEHGSSQARLPSTIVKHPDQIFSYNGLDNSSMNGNRNFVNYITSPGISENGPSPHANANPTGNNNGGGGYSSNSFQNFMSDVTNMGNMRSIDESLSSFMGGPYSSFAAAAATQQNINNPYSNIQNFVSDLGAATANNNVLQGVSSYPNGFNPGRRSSCPPEFLASVNNLQLSMNEENGGGAKQKGLETIKEDDVIELND